jgi:xanthine/CO dehydrogenase XdhC/CoxF family maturation factor
MRERDAIVAAYLEARAAGRQSVLATVVRVEGSSYRGPGARMLVLEQGDHVGGVSGGCLERDVVMKAFFRTEKGSALEAFSTRSDDDARPYGMGCEGVVHVLLQRLEPKAPCLPIDVLVACRQARAACALATIVGVQGDGGRAGASVGDQIALLPGGRLVGRLGAETPSQAIHAALAACLETGSRERDLELGGQRARVLFERVEPPRALVVFGAGDDAMPVVRIAKELGWHVTVADGRAHYATAARFPTADQVLVTSLDAPLARVSLPAAAACVVMSHSFDQDQAVLTALAPLSIGYLGLLGPRARRQALLESIGPMSFACASGLHSPVGLDIGSCTPEEIALAIVAEAHACLAGRAGGSLRDRAAAEDARAPAALKPAASRPRSDP